MTVAYAFELIYGFQVAARPPAKTTDGLIEKRNFGLAGIKNANHERRYFVRRLIFLFFDGSLFLPGEASNEVSVFPK
jgi:hypothetical protein